MSFLLSIWGQIGLTSIFGIEPDLESIVVKMLYFAYLTGGHHGFMNLESDLKSHKLLQNRIPYVQIMWKSGITHNVRPNENSIPNSKF